ncbi:hypothetical protein Syun_023924 [Stephania yunnanensis]|uniref:Protein COFACTOR ASSEMBLY OF COMPLEX C SUBUNIT B CCB4, chloroplastic n=1 Tax=Stephania yunnanensis TaxID=152371 RepID=A0AAP0FIJ7_9MAGN
MEAGVIVGSINRIPTSTRTSSPLRRHPIGGGSWKNAPRRSRRMVVVFDYGGPRPKRDWIGEWVSRNDDAVRSLPIYVGGLSLLAVLFNRAVSGIAPVADASSSQSRADLLTLGLAVTNVLTGLVWLSIRPKSISAVNPQGVECRKILPDLPVHVASELQWYSTFYKYKVIVDCFGSIKQKSCLLNGGMLSLSEATCNAMAVDAAKVMNGTLYQGVRKSGAQNYLANLSLYPGRSELPFLPLNTQAVILQPLGDKGFIIIGGDTIRGFTSSDQAWITLISEKLDSTISKFEANLPLPVQDGLPA